MARQLFPISPKHIWPTLGLFLAFVALALLIRPVRVVDQAGSRLICLWAWDSGRVEFINSVTHRPVAINFKLPWRFADFSVETDPGTEEYYTSGEYSWSARLATESRRKLVYCSQVGIKAILAEQAFVGREGCLEIELLWPPG